MANYSGLTEQEARERLKNDGPNELVRKKQRGAAEVFFSQFKDILVIILAAATCVSVTVGEYYEALAIISIMLLNAVLGFIQEYRTEKSLAALSALSAPVANVTREGRPVKIPATELVKGDVISLKSGDRVPADARILDCAGLLTDESLLTGESHHAAKSARSAVFMGTGVVAGHGRAVVEKTGMDTEMGKIAGMLSEIKEDPTPLQLRLRTLGKVVAISCLVVCAAVASVGMLRGEPVLDMILTGLSLAVAAIPEGLPAVVTVVLALSVNRMLKKGAIIRRLHAVESLGCASVICCDKTGTITQNRMTVQRAYAAGELFSLGGGAQSVNGELELNGDRTEAQRHPALCEALRGAVLCSSAFVVRLEGENLVCEGSPTEKALLTAAEKCGIDSKELRERYPTLREKPFDSTSKLMEVTVKDAGGEKTYIKGAAERVLRLCGYSLECGEKPLDSFRKDRIFAAERAMTDRALRVIAVARRTAKGTVFLGLFGMEDPPRPEVPAAVRTCRSAHIRVIMITGDSEDTARAVAREVGITGETVNAASLDTMDDAALDARLRTAGVFARVSPKHKLRIVRRLKAMGEVVAMTGDGVNDAPAVKEADVGVAMGISGTDVTKEAAGVIITDDNFATVVAAVEEGRIIYQNIRAFIRYLLTCNLGEVLTVLIAMLMRLPVIFAPIQLLVINLITDGLPAIALGLEEGSQGLMKQKPRPKNESLFAGGLGAHILLRGLVLGGCNVASYVTAMYMGADHAQAASAAYITLVFSQMLYVLEGRVRRGGSLKSLLHGSAALPLAVMFSAFCTLATVYFAPLAAIFQCEAVPAGLLLSTALCTLASLAIGALISRFSDK